MCENVGLCHEQIFTKIHNPWKVQVCNKVNSSSGAPHPLSYVMTMPSMEAIFLRNILRTKPNIFIHVPKEILRNKSKQGGTFISL